jgi:hypothetical protein
MEEFKQKRQKDNQLKHEKEQLRFVDQQKNLIRKKRQIVSIHAQIHFFRNERRSR